MLYDFLKPEDVSKAREYLEKLIKREDKAELKKVLPPKSNKQNRYLHALINLFAIEYGEDAAFTKQTILKKYACKSIFQDERINRINGKVREDWRSVADLDIGETVTVIDMFRTWSSKTAGIYLPTSEEYESNYLEYLNEINKHKEYL